MTKIEQIGKVNLDLTFYSGADLYCDGTVEEELLQIAQNHSETEYPHMIEEHGSWEVLYHLSVQRENIIEWLPIDKSMKVLEVGAGCGAITGALSRKAGSVTCVDLSKKRSMINAYRHRDCENVTIFVGNYLDIEASLPCDYDYICLIGVLEYAQSYIGTETPFEKFLNSIKGHLKKDGHMVIAIENRFGLKYWAGCQEDHLGTYFSGIEGYPDGGPVRTFTRDGLESILQKSGIEEYTFYYPYPDYKFMTTLYSDEYQPKKGELSNNLRNFDRERMILFDEKKVFDSISEEGLFPLYSNSYLVVTGKKPDTCYVKYSNDRQRCYQIRTEILPVSPTGMGKNNFPKLLVVRKHPLCKEACEHIKNIDIAYWKLRERYTEGELRINRCRLVEEEEGWPYVELEYIVGVTLAELLEDCMKRKDQERFLKLFEKYLSMLDYHSETPVADFDMVFSNIIISAKDRSKPYDGLDNSVWTLIDYEWVFGKQLDTKELAFRALYCFLLEDQSHKELDLDGMRKKLQVSEEEAETFKERERDFQRFVTGNGRSMGELRNLLDHKCYHVKTILEKVHLEEKQGRIQVYEDRGEGFREENSYFADGCLREDEEGLHLRLAVETGVQGLRIDPAFTDCLVRIKELRWNGTVLSRRGKYASFFKSNGTRLGRTDSFIFPTEDPNLVISLGRLAFEEKNCLELCLERSLVDRDTALDIESAAKRRFRL